MRANTMRWLQRLTRRSETGQSIILLAIGFVALIAFIGITTDISLLFVRYSQLSRAVDSASIAAANQVRQDRTLASVRLAATQFIEFHGRNPVQIDVQMCETLPEDQREDDELCTDDQAKLVRVTAITREPTVFMRVLGIDSFPLRVSAVSQTAALDVVLIIDVSESMARYTSVEDWAQIERRMPDRSIVREGQGVIYRPPRVLEILQRKGYGVPQESDFYQTGIGGTVPGLLNRPQIEVNNRLYYLDATGNPIAQQDLTGVDTDYRVFSDANFFAAQYGPQTHPREECRIRFYPTDITVSRFPGYYRGGQLVNLQELYNDSALDFSGDTRFRGFVPTYNFYGCCNDPDGNGLFDDLVCQPFKQARDASFEFLDRIDFLRGDRAGFVTFDQSAFLVNPYGSFVDDDGNTQRLGGMIDNAADAYETLRTLIGVRAEPNFYRFNEGTFVPNTQDPKTARWDSFAAGILADGRSRPIDYGDASYSPFDGQNPLSWNYPVNDNCPFQNADARPDRTLWDYALSNISLPSGAEWNNYRDGTVSYVIQSSPQRIVNGNFSYDYWSSCRGTNFGAALREGNNALLNPRTIRRFGTIWVMVLLSDGAAGASDPVRRNGEKLQASNPYVNVGTVSAPRFGSAGQYGAYGLCPFGTPTQPGELMLPVNDGYRFPFCSDESPQTRHQCNGFRPRLTLPPTNNATAMQDNDYVLFNPALPYGLNGPQTQEDEVPWNIRNNNLFDVDLADCDMLYDVDDYARDWADYVALRNDSSSTVTLLPTIFTIAFGLEFSNRTAADGRVLDIGNQVNAQEICNLNVADCLGEQLLRYIADVGDNNAIDNHYYKYLSDPGMPGALFNSQPFGQRDRCQTNTADVQPLNGRYDYNGDGFLGANEEDAMYGYLRPQLSCGNYYFAPDGNELRFVFDDIASRMFTRLSR